MTAAARRGRALATVMTNERAVAATSSALSPTTASVRPAARTRRTWRPRDVPDQPSPMRAGPESRKTDTIPVAVASVVDVRGDAVRRAGSSARPRAGPAPASFGQGRGWACRATPASRGSRPDRSSRRGRAGGGGRSSAGGRRATSQATNAGSPRAQRPRSEERRSRGAPARARPVPAAAGEPARRRRLDGHSLHGVAGKGILPHTARRAEALGSRSRWPGCAFRARTRTMMIDLGSLRWFPGPTRSLALTLTFGPGISTAPVTIRRLDEVRSLLRDPERDRTRPPLHDLHGHPGAGPRGGAALARSRLRRGRLQPRLARRRGAALAGPRALGAGQRPASPTPRSTSSGTAAASSTCRTPPTADVYGRDRVEAGTGRQGRDPAGLGARDGQRRRRGRWPSARSTRSRRSCSTSRCGSCRARRTTCSPTGPSSRTRATDGAGGAARGAPTRFPEHGIGHGRPALSGEPGLLELVSRPERYPAVWERLVARLRSMTGAPPRSSRRCCGRARCRSRPWPRASACRSRRCAATSARSSGRGSCGAPTAGRPR